MTIAGGTAIPLAEESYKWLREKAREDKKWFLLKS
jgi:hypothetical protein